MWKPKKRYFEVIRAFFPSPYTSFYDQILILKIATVLEQEIQSKV